MNKKGEMNLLGTLLMGAIAIIVGATMLSGAIFPSIGEQITTSRLVNQTIAKDTTIDGFYFNGKAVSGVTLINSTAVNTREASCGTSYNNTGCIIDAGNYTIQNNILHPTTGQIVSKLKWVAGSGNYNGSVKATYTTEGTNYIQDPASRTLTDTIGMFSAIALIAAALGAIAYKELM